MGFLYIAFFWGFKYLKKNFPYNDAMSDILLRGGDTDTNAAIVGGLLGAAQGINAIPYDWVLKVANYDATIKHDKYGRVRPEFLSPQHHLIPLIKAVSMN